MVSTVAEAIQRARSPQIMAIAAEVGLPPDHVRRWRNGNTADLTPWVLNVIARHCDGDVNEWLTRRANRIANAEMYAPKQWAA